MTHAGLGVYASDADGGAPAAMADAPVGREYATLPGVRMIRVDGSRHFIMATSRSGSPSDRISSWRTEPGGGACPSSGRAP
jgi:hypothetical protein